MMNKANQPNKSLGQQLEETMKRASLVFYRLSQL